MGVTEGRIRTGGKGLSARKEPQPKLRPEIGTSGRDRAYFRSRWRRPPEAGAGDSVFSIGGDSRSGEVRFAPSDSSLRSGGRRFVG